MKNIYLIYARALSFVRLAVLTYAGLGLLVGTLYGGICELTVVPWLRLPRRRFYLTSLLLAAVLFIACVYTQKYVWKPMGLINLGIRLPIILAGQWLVGLVILVLTMWIGRKASPRSAAILVHPWRSLGLWILAVGVVYLLPELPSFGGSSVQSERPNVLLIVLDTTRYDRLSVNGYSRSTTPALDKIAREGMRFTRCNAPSPWTLPSHASFFTGMYPTEHGATRRYMYLDTKHPTWAEAMNQQGYRTVAIHKQPILYESTGLVRGFSSVYDLNQPVVEDVSALMEALELMITGLPWDCRVGVREPPHVTKCKKDAGADQINTTALNWLDHHAGRPFFMFVNYMEPHEPLAPPSPFREQYLGAKNNTPWGKEKFANSHLYSSGRITYTAEDLAIFSDLYDAEVAYQDHRLEQLIAALKARGLLDNTLLIITADHGEALGEHEIYGHMFTLYQTVLHVPLLMRYPPLIPGGEVIDQTVSNRRIWPLVDRFLAYRRGDPPLTRNLFVSELTDSATGGGVVSEEDQIPMSPSSQWPSELARNITESRQQWWTGAPREALAKYSRKCLVDGRYKYVWIADGTEQFFDLEADPDELTDLSSQNPPEMAKLRARLKGASVLWPTTTAPSRPIDEEMQRKLRSLGYIE